MFDKLTPLETSTFPQLYKELPISVRSFLYKKSCQILYGNFINQVEIMPTILTRHHKLWFPLLQQSVTTLSQRKDSGDNDSQY